MIKKPRITEKLYKWNAIKQKLRLKSCKNWHGLKIADTIRKNTI